MKAAGHDEFNDNISLYKRTIWIRLPGLLMVGSILLQRSGFFHYVGFAFIAWAALELLIYVGIKIMKFK